MADTVLPSPNPARGFEISTEMSDEEIVATLNSYRTEARDARANGMNPRDQKWSRNLDLYWGRFDFSRKAQWQAQEVMPEVSSYVDRFAAALKEALTVGDFFTVDDPADKDRDIARGIERMTSAWLSKCGRNRNGQIAGFPSVFEEQVKMGALMACCAVVNWKDDAGKGRVAIEGVDPRGVWFDHTYRNLYRVRRIEIDRHDLRAMVGEKDSRGRQLFKTDAIERIVTQMEQDLQAQREELTGTGQMVQSARQPIVLDEYLATIVGPDGKVAARDALCVVANEEHLLRGPEANPFWHQNDWLLFAPLVTVPLSVYGRSYMEDFGSVASTFNELTNLILDATYTASMKMFAVVPSMLLNPGQAAEGASPNKMFLLEDGVRPSDFWGDVDMGSLPPEAVAVWKALKQELSEAAGINEIGLGQFAPKGRTSAFEVASAQENSSALVRSVAQTVESGFLEPMLDLVWKTGLQHVSRTDAAIADAAGPQLFQALMGRRRELVRRPMTFRAHGISALIRKGKLLRSLLQVMQIIAGNELLLREFLRVADMERLVELLFDLSDIDMRKLQTTERERLMRSVTAPLEEAAGQAEAGLGGGGPAASEAAAVADALGITRGGGSPAPTT